MIQWLNANSGFVMSVLTLVYVVSTVILVRLSRSELSEMRSERRFRELANVVLGLKALPGGFVEFYLTNAGASVAFEVSVTFNDEFLRALPGNRGQSLEALSTAKITLVPGQVLRFGTIGSGECEISKLPDAIATVKYRCGDDCERRCFVFSFGSMGPILFRGTEIEELEYSLRKQLGMLKDALASRRMGNE